MIFLRVRYLKAIHILELFQFLYLLIIQIWKHLKEVDHLKTVMLKFQFPLSLKFSHMGLRYRISQAHINLFFFTFMKFAFNKKLHNEAQCDTYCYRRCWFIRSISVVKTYRRKPVVC